MDVGQPILDLALSPDKDKLAFTFGTETTGLKVFGMKEGKTTEFIPATERIRYPVWSTDSIYLAAWNSGRSNILFDMVTKRRQLEIEASGSAEPNLGKIVFLSNQPKISYVENGSLYEMEYTGGKKVKIVDGVSPTSPHYYSMDSRFVVFHNSSNQLMLFNKSTGSIQMLAESDSGNPFGRVVAFAGDKPTLVYYNGGSSGNQFYSYNANNGSGEPFFKNRQTVLPFTSMLANKSRQKLLVVEGGFDTYTVGGVREAYCPYTQLSYDYGYFAPELWSPDGQFVLSPKTAKIAGLNNCSLSGEFVSEIPDQVIWLK
ncbi:MAG: hypothetical protein G01um101416_1003 [Microgenomates group bacterium Gr01-1014_16]|nr:MAG: hypothetical protein G01um101416_1003 [Microgenomates group bacterium Gr01-1014_16]